MLPGPFIPIIPGIDRNNPILAPFCTHLAKALTCTSHQGQMVNVRLDRVCSTQKMGLDYLIDIKPVNLETGSYYITQSSHRDRPN